MRTYLRLLHSFYAMRERRYIDLTAKCEELRRHTLTRIALLDAPKPYKEQRYRKLLKLLWEGL